MIRWLEAKEPRAGVVDDYEAHPTEVQAKTDENAINFSGADRTL